MAAHGFYFILFSFQKRFSFEPFLAYNFCGITNRDVLAFFIRTGKTLTLLFSFKFTEENYIITDVAHTDLRLAFMILELDCT